MSLCSSQSENLESGINSLTRQVVLCQLATMWHAAISQSSVVMLIKVWLANRNAVASGSSSSYIFCVNTVTRRGTCCHRHLFSSVVTLMTMQAWVTMLSCDGWEWPESAAMDSVAAEGKRFLRYGVAWRIVSSRLSILWALLQFHTHCFISFRAACYICVCRDFRRAM